MMFRTSKFVKIMMFRTQKSRTCGVQNTTKTLCFGVFRTLLPDVQNICKFFNAMFWTPQNTGLGGVLNISSKITPNFGVQNTPQKWRKCSEHSENVVNTGWTLPPKTGEMFRTPTPLCSEPFQAYPAAQKRYIWPFQRIMLSQQDSRLFCINLGK